MRIGLVITAVILCGYGQSGRAETFPAPGSGIAAETYNPNDLENITSGDTRTSGVLKSTRMEAWLRAPIPVAFLYGLVTVQAKLKSDAQKSGFTDARPLDDPSLPLIPEGSHKENRSVIAAGFTWHPHHKEGAPRYYIALERSGLPDGAKTILPFASYTLGSNIGEDDLPIPFSFSATDITETKIYLTGHRFTKYNRFDLGAGHKIKTKNGFVLDLLIPRHFLIGYAGDFDSWFLYGGITRDMEFLPWFAEVERGWSEDLREKRKIGIRIKIYAPVFLVLEAGQERRRRERFNYEGERSGALTTGFAPIARLAIETWHQVL